MALRFLDGFDSYVTADLTKKWPTVNGTMTISAGTGRRSTASLRCANQTVSYVARTFDAQGTWTLGVALRFTTMPTSTTDLLRWYDGGTQQCELRITTTGTLQVTRNGTILGTSTNALALNTYRYIELRLVIHNTTGQAEVRVDGASWLALTNQDTQNSANATADTLRLGVIQTTLLGNLDIDDLYICDGTGSAPHNGLLGDCRVDTLLPNAEGSPQQWTPSTGTSHYQLVDDAAPNTTDYVSNATPTQRELFGMQDLSAVTGTIYGAQLGLAALKSDAGARSVKALIVSGASEALGTAQALSTSQTYLLHVQTTDPATGAAWTETAVNGALCGVETA